MPSSITLTVSHLPTSTSFFLSALQPLDYMYRGRSDNTIGFGSSTNPSAPSDFWITQEMPGVPAGAAHVAFPASSRTAVQHFFTAALKAGGNIHGEPAVRDSSGYYSAAVIDFDGNSIEAVFRPDYSENENDVKSIVSTRTVTKAPSGVQSQVSRAPSEFKTSVSRAAPRSEAPSVSRKPSGDILEGVISEARSATNVARTLIQSVHGSLPPQSPPLGTGEGNAIIGTLLGVAAGAALHYAFTQTKESRSRPSVARSNTEPTALSYHQSYGHLDDLQYLALEDHDRQSTLGPGRSSHRPSHCGQTVYCTEFGNGSATSKPSQRPKLLEAPPPSSITAFPSQLSRSAAHHLKSASTVTGSRPSAPRHASDRTITPTSKHPPSTLTTATSKPHRHNVLRTSSESHLQYRTTPPSTAALSRAPQPTPHPIPTHSIRAPLSEANLARTTSAPAVTAVTAPPTTISLHRRNRELETYPVEVRSRPGAGKGRRRSESTRDHQPAGAAASSRGERRTAGLDVVAAKGEVRPEDSVSQISSVRSGVSRSTVRRVGGGK